MPPAAHQPRPAGALTLANTLLGVRRPRRLRACRPRSYGGASFPARCACLLAMARLTTFQVTSPGDDLRRPRRSSKASLERSPVHTRRLRRMAGRQPPIATPRAVRELQQHQQHGLFHLRPQVNLGRQRTDRLPCKYVTTVVRSLRVLTPTAMKVIYPSFVGARRGASHSNAARPDAESQPDAAVDLARYDHSDSHAPASPTVRWNAGRQSQ